MPKEYRTIQEVSGPLMLVREVEGVKYNELGEIELANGETRRCRVLEIDGTNALVQLFENSAGINLANSKVRFSGRQMELGIRSASRKPRGSDSASGKGARRQRAVRRCLCGNGYNLRGVELLCRELQKHRRARQNRYVLEPRKRPRHRAYRNAEDGFDRRGISRV